MRVEGRRARAVSVENAGAIARSAAVHHPTDPTPFPTAHATAPAAPRHRDLGRQRQVRGARRSRSLDRGARAESRHVLSRRQSPARRPMSRSARRSSADTELCLIEVMKLFTSVLAGVAGTVRQSLVEDCGTRRIRSAAVPDRAGLTRAHHGAAAHPGRQSRRDRAADRARRAQRSGSRQCLPPRPRIATALPRAKRTAWS